MSNAYAKGQEIQLRELSNQIKKASTDEAVELLYSFGTGAYVEAYERGFKAGQSDHIDFKGD